MNLSIDPFVTDLVLSVIAGCLISLVVTKRLIGYLRRKAVLDIPNERSSHTVPTPRGGGIGILAVVIPVMVLIGVFREPALPGWWAAFAGMIILAGISFVDDLRSLGAGVRLGSHILCVALVLFVMPWPGAGLVGGPETIEKLVVGLAWAWFINLFNFMDGIDGIAGCEIIAICLGIVLIFPDLPNLMTLSAFVIGGALGFLRYNWHPAKIFMGDIGSVSMGYLLGWMLLLLALEGYLVSAIILPLYFVADATVTLVRRGWRKEKVWRAHREHFYQKALQGGLNPPSAMWRINLCNVLLICLAVVAYQGYEVVGLVMALAVVAITLMALAVGNSRPPNG